MAMARPEPISGGQSYRRLESPHAAGCLFFLVILVILVQNSTLGRRPSHLAVNVRGMPYATGWSWNLYHDPV